MIAGGQQPPKFRQTGRTPHKKTAARGGRFLYLLPKDQCPFMASFALSAASFALLAAFLAASAALLAASAALPAASLAIDMVSFAVPELAGAIAEAALAALAA